MIKIILVLLFVSSLFSEIIDGVAIVVNKEPITLYEIDNLMQKKQLTRKVAIVMLINDRLKKYEIKKFGIDVDSFELDHRISLIAKNNHLTPKQFKQLIIAKGMDWDEFKDNVKNAMKEEIYFGTILQSNYKELTQKEKEEFYKKNRDNFSDSFENSQREIRILYFKQKEKEIMQAHFEKLKSKADIRFVR